MKIVEDYPLAKLSSMRLGGTARYFAEVTSRVELREAVGWARGHKLPYQCIGGGNNIVFTDAGFKGLIIANRLKGLKLVQEHGAKAVIEAAAGEQWDDLVDFVCRRDLSGVEALSAIPGTVGAAPVQNIGAYGQDLAAVFDHLEALDARSGRYVSLTKEDCHFLYRSSAFKPDHPRYNSGRYLITKVVLELSRGRMQPPFYTTLQKYLDEHRVTDYSPPSIRRAVIAWRQQYLPDPKKNPNVGSFFKNPIVTKKQLDTILARNPSIADWPTQWYWPNEDGSYKVAAGRLADHLGLKGWKDKATGMGTWKTQALVLVNYRAARFQDLQQFLAKYRERIRQAYGVELELEPEIIQ